MSLIEFLPKLPELVRRIQQNKSELIGQYHEFECYGGDELKQYGLTVLTVVGKHRRLLVTHKVDK